MVALGLILLIIGLVAKISILWTIGVILLLVGLVLNFVPIGGNTRRRLIRQFRITQRPPVLWTGGRCVGGRRRGTVVRRTSAAGVSFPGEPDCTQVLRTSPR